MAIKFRKIQKINIVRIIIALFVILGSLSDYVNSYTDDTIQKIATCDKMGYGGLYEYRLHMITDVIQATIYILLVFLIHHHKNKQSELLLAIIDGIILFRHLCNVFEI